MPVYKKDYFSKIRLKQYTGIEKGKIIRCVLTIDSKDKIVAYLFKHKRRTKITDYGKQAGMVNTSG